TTLEVSTATLVSIAVTPTNPTIALGTTQHFTATGTFSDSATEDLTDSVTWGSSALGLAAVSNAVDSKGLVTSLAAGSATISATSGAVSGSTTLEVSTATLVSIAVTPTNPTIALGTTQHFTATGTYTDGSTQDLTDSVTWSSSSTIVATISNSANTKGRATTVLPGVTTIAATRGAVSGLTILTVTPI